MLHIPLPFIAALLLSILLFRIIRTEGPGTLRKPTTIFNALCTLLAIVGGVRWTYKIEFLHVLQPILASIMPALAWICFSDLMYGPRVGIRVWGHFIPTIIIALGTMTPWPSVTDMVDPFLTLLFLGYGAALLRFGSKGPDALRAVRLADSANALWAIHTAAIVLILSGLIDLSIAVDIRYFNASFAPIIVTIATLAILPLLAYAIAVAGSSVPSEVGSSGFSSSEDAALLPASDETASCDSKTTGLAEADPENDLRIIASIDALMTEKRLYRNPDLTLTRLASRAGIPMRQISGAINRIRQCNVSQFVNAYRVQEAKRLLAHTDESVTDIMLDSGFQTKSNFNREFRRMTGMNPSEFRQLAAASGRPSRNADTSAPASPHATPERLDNTQRRSKSAGSIR